MPARLRPRWLRGVLIAIALSTGLSANAAEPPIKSYRLELKKTKEIEHGRVAVVKGDAGAQPHRFLVDGVNMNMPVVVVVRPLRKSDSVDLRLTKYGWDQILREGTAKGEPLAFKFRTEGEFQIAVTSAAKTPYRLLVWTGDETEPELRPVVVKASEYQASSSGNSSSTMSPVLWVIAIALIAIVALLGVLVLRKKS